MQRDTTGFRVWLLLTTELDGDDGRYLLQRLERISHPEAKRG
jgi:hypothetical protein